MKNPLLLLTLGLFMLCANSIWAQTLDSITGRWITFDDETNQPAALVQISEKNGLFSGVVTKILDPKSPANCDKCRDQRKGKPILGMEILTSLKKTGDNYSGGRILDPDEGEIYKLEMKLKDQGAKLELRGYIGIPLLRRTQTWIRNN